MVERIIANPSAQTLGKKALAFYLTHPKTTDYVYQGADEIVALFKNYCEESKILIKRYLIDEFRKLS
ncbi:MAG: hypothetical protein KDK60_03710, partial [Chlamydiia bacterium]|nr:hypothetical protein [Chlamydiia bacterium]